jgi:large subunit ribosomal protein L6
VEISVKDGVVSVKGPKAQLQRALAPGITVSVKDGTAVCSPSAAETPQVRALWGLTNVLINNMITGVTKGYRSVLEIVGVGYKAELKGKDLSISVGFAKPVLIQSVPGIGFKLEGPNKIVIESADKERLGDMAARIRSIRPPEPYQGKGIRYEGEFIRKKAGKTAGK